MLEIRQLLIAALFALAVCAWIGILLVVEGYSQQSPGEYVQSAGNNQSNAGDRAAPTEATTMADHNNPGYQAQPEREQGTEFWPPVFGVRLKITDTLLVLFTAVLAVC